MVLGSRTDSLAISLGYGFGREIDKSLTRPPLEMAKLGQRFGGF